MVTTRPMTIEHRSDTYFTIYDYLAGRVPENKRLLCPFHGDTIPSAKVLPETGRFWCYSCTIAEDRLGVAMRLLWPERYNKKPPAPYLAADVRVANAWLDHQGFSQHIPITHEAAPVVVAAGVYSVMTIFGELANAELAKNAGAKAQLKAERGLDDPVGLGLGLGHWRVAGQLAKRCKLEVPDWEERGADYLHLAGISTDPVKATEEKPQHYRLADRFIVPEWRMSPTHKSAFGPPNTQFVCYYQARARDPESPVKYLNPYLPKALYGLRSLHTDSDFLWIGEGPFDVLPLIAAGESAIATLGIHLADAGTEELRAAIGGRLCLICYDNDQPNRERGETLGAGRVQALALHAKLSGAGIAAMIITTPEPYQDLGDWLTAVGAREVIASVRLAI